MRYIHSFIFSKCFILTRVAVDAEPIPGTPGARQEHILVERQFFAQTHSPLGNSLSSSVCLPACL